ncbi:hypothetical protein LWI29_022593 [Acer saccharum]|uniref:DM2 domain-containing protein n=1 Tax=Acer saccharum TaxID=4024 RepID=A0AA39S9I6_ACESA|nr:hypothetical protein LWI29_022593 [Acer saccharum]
MKGETIKSKKKIEFKEWGSKPLLGFLASIGKETNQELSQIDVSSLILEYCKQNNLFHPENTKKIICDSKLEALFRRKSVNINNVYSLLTTHLAENINDSGSGSEDVDHGDEFIVRKSCFAAIVPENVKLVYLRKSLIDKMSMKLDTFEAKVIGSFVRVKSEHPNDYNMLRNSDHQLVQVTGVKRCSSMSSSEILLRVSDMVKEVPISKLSDDDFTKYIDSLLLLQTPAEQSRLLNEVPQVLADTYEDPIRKGDGDTSEAQEAALESTADLFNDDCAKSSEASGNEGEADWSIDAVRSTMTPTSLETLKRSYGIPNNIVLRLPEKGQLASSPPQGAVTLHSTFFEFAIWKKPSELTTEQKNNIKTAFAIPSEDRSCKVLLTPKNLKRYWFTVPPSTSTMPSSSQGRMKRYHPEQIPVEPIKVSTKKMKVRSSSQAGSPPVSENSPPRHASKMTRKSFENDKKILFDQVNQEVEKNSKLQGQLDEEKAMSARLREHIADLKATVTDATSRADEAVARADVAERDNRELRKVNKELKDGITSWEEAAIKQLSSQQKLRR